MRVLATLAGLALLGACRIPVGPTSRPAQPRRVLAVEPHGSLLAWPWETPRLGPGVGLRTVPGGRGWEAAYSFDFLVGSGEWLKLHTLYGGYSLPMGHGVRLAAGGGLGYGRVVSSNSDVLGNGYHAVIEGRAEVTITRHVLLGSTLGYLHSQEYGGVAVETPRQLQFRAPQLRVFFSGTL